MTNAPKSSLVALALLLALAALAGPALAPRAARAQEGEDASAGSVDVVYLTNGKKRSGEIVEEFAVRVKIKVAGDQIETIKREDIARVEYKDRPSEFRQADMALAKGDAESAVAALKAAVEGCDGGRVRPLFKAQALLRLGRALVAWGKYDDAAEAFKAACNAAPAGPYLRDAIREGVRAYVRGGNAKKGIELAEAAKDMLKKAELGDDALDEASLLKNEALEASGKVEEARMGYSLLTNSRDPRVRGRASLGAARGALAAKDIERAESKFREIIDDKDVERSVKCGAARGLGDAILARPGARKDVEKLRAAAAAYAQALAVAFPARDEPTGDREGALAACADVYDALAGLSKGEKETKARDLYKAMAQQLREELVRLYKNSPLRAEVEQKLGAGEESKQ
jgi:tetratricopeptide (TPR) repeat protein